MLEMHGARRNTQVLRGQIWDAIRQVPVPPVKVNGAGLGLVVLSDFWKLEVDTLWEMGLKAARDGVRGRC